MQTFVIVSNNVCISLGILPSCEQLAAHTACVRGGFGSVSLTPPCWPPLFCHFAMPQPGCWGGSQWRTGAFLLLCFLHHAAYTKKQPVSNTNMKLVWNYPWNQLLMGGRRGKASGTRRGNLATWLNTGTFLLGGAGTRHIFCSFHFSCSKDFPFTAAWQAAAPVRGPVSCAQRDVCVGSN